MNLLETLYGAKASLEGRQYVFSNWSHCTCGHIYYAAHGHVAEGDGYAAHYTMEESENVTFKEMLEVISRVNGWDIQPQDDLGLLLTAVSNLTYDTCERPRGNGTLRENAIRLVGNAIEYVEAREREAMLAIADPTRHEFALGAD